MKDMIPTPEELIEIQAKSDAKFVQEAIGLMVERLNREFVDGQRVVGNIHKLNERVKTRIQSMFASRGWDVTFANKQDEDKSEFLEFAIKQNKTI